MFHVKHFLLKVSRTFFLRQKSYKIKLVFIRIICCDNFHSRTFFLSQKKYQKRQGKTKLSTRSVIRQELQPKMGKPLRRNSKPYHIHAHAGPQFCRADAHVLLYLRGYFIKKWLSQKNRFKKIPKNA